MNPVPPSLANLILRPIARDDLAVVLDLAGACYITDGGLHFMIEPDFLQDRYFPEAPGSAIGAFAADGRLVACATVHLGGDTGKQHATIVGQVHARNAQPGHRRLPDALEPGTGRRLCWPLPKQGNITLSSGPNRSPSSAHHLYLAHGFNPEDIQLVMRRDLLQPLPDRSLPPDVTITTWQPALADQFYQAYHAAFRERPGFPGFTAAEWVDNWTTDRFVPEWSFLACVGDDASWLSDCDYQSPGQSCDAGRGNPFAAQAWD